MRRSPAWLLLGSLATSAIAQVGDVPSVGAPAKDSTPTETGGGGLRWRLPPVAWNGTVALDLHRDRSDVSGTRQGRLLTTTFSGVTYVYAPWFALLNGSLGLTLDHSSNSGNSGSESSDASGRFATGKLQLSLFPRSRFPSELRYEVADSRTDTSLGGGVDYRTRNLSVSQRYRPVNSEFTVSASIDRRVQDSVQYGQETQDSMLAEFSSRWKRQQLSASLNRNTNRREGTGEETDLLSLVARHSLDLGSSASVESSANWTRSDNRLLSGESGLVLAQLSSLGMWRSETRPLTVTGGLRVLSIRGNGFEGNSSLSASAGASYELTRNARLQGSIQVSRTNGETLITPVGVMSLTYQGDQRQWGAMLWSWYAGTSLSASRSIDGVATNLSTQLGNNLSRTWEIGTSTLVASFAQGGSATVSQGTPSDSIEPLLSDRVSKSLTHSMSLNWNRPSAEGAAFARLSMSDARQLNNERAHFQQANFQLSGTYEVDRSRSLSGDITLQRTIQKSLQVQRPGDFDPFLLDVQQKSSGGSGEVSWRHSRLFNVPRLNFSSRFRVALDTQNASNQLLALADRETLSWENRLDYRVGRLDSSISLRLARVDGRQQMFAMWRLQRSFGG